MNMNIIGKLFGLFLVIIGFLLCYIEYLISTTITKIADIIAVAVGLDGSASLGLAIIFHIPIGGLMLAILFMIIAAFYFGYAFIVES